jgi:uncharacterized repeat protein (TIGR03803 family)
MTDMRKNIVSVSRQAALKPNWIVFSFALLLCAFAAASTAQAQTYTVLHAFTGGADGGGPNAGLIGDSAGNLYGTASIGGSGCFDCGVVFKIDPLGHETVLHNFSGADGEYVNAPVIRDAAGNLYGITGYGGIQSACNGVGCGVVFKIDPHGNETTLYSFTGGADGANPAGPVIRDSAANLEGTTYFGGDKTVCTMSGCGVVFKVDASGNETVLYTFTGEADGAQPYAGLIRDARGNYYGTTLVAGSLGNGVVFKLDAFGNETVLYDFGGADGANPVAGVIRDSAGNLYGATNNGGEMASCYKEGCGVVFKIDPQGQETILHEFTGGLDGAFPDANLIRDTAGNLYGTAYGGGRENKGVVFEIDPAGNERVLHDFNGEDGASPLGSLLLFNGALYGTTAQGGRGFGVVFKISLR